MISADVAEPAGGRAAVRDAGRRELRGVPGTWQLYRVG